MTINGKDGDGQEFVLREKAFEKGEKFSVSLQAIAVGEITDVKLRMDT